MSRLDAEIEVLQNCRQTGPANKFGADTFGTFNGRFQHAQFRPAYNKGNIRMGIFSRTRDIIAANFNDLLDKAEDPAKMIRLIILEMEETLVEVRTSSARTIADQKELRRHVAKLDKLQADWSEKAQLALSKGREDLARAALLERKKATDMADQLNAEIAVLDDSLRAYEQDIEKLQNRLREARSRQSAIAARLQSAENRIRLRTLLSNERVDEALARFDQLERRVDYAEGRAEAMSLGDSRQPTLAEEIAALADGDTIEAELAEMKRAMGSDAPKPVEDPAT
ncbi:phage shock protein PspA [Novosphingobium album (ex Hu et al. 2023)]|uniref:Phage shock protein PspA n=1 Tax=Novosphingobium album (ex Hu et al. 2023) TaxID=2930093 RepID=A0ABT0AZM9_9SPHN|nr:phage shock protein PspA [Novosphingobium album (ex Hu et al. 2023)]MCJ2178123.1 phage shock protein PspA [Novosphingobium album (ex Hu et al. 2023)]